MAKSHKQSTSKYGRGHASWHTVVYQVLGSFVGMIALLVVAPFVPGLKSLLKSYVDWASPYMVGAVSVKRKGIKTAAAAHDLNADMDDSDASAANADLHEKMPPDDVKKLAGMVPTVVYIAISSGCHYCIKWGELGYKQKLIDRCCKEPNVAVVIAEAAEYYLSEVEFLPWISVVLADGSCVPLEANREDAEACLKEAIERSIGGDAANNPNASDDQDQVGGSHQTTAPVRTQPAQFIGSNTNSPAFNRLAPLHS